MKDLKKYLLIKIGEEFYGIDILYVKNVVRIPKITRVPKSQPYFLGIINLRGEIIAVMSLKGKMAAWEKSDTGNESVEKLEDDLFTDDSRIVILNIGDLGNVGLIADQAGGMIVLAKEEMRRRQKTLKAGRDSFVYGTGTYGDEIVSLLDIEAVARELA